MRIVILICCFVFKFCFVFGQEDSSTYTFDYENEVYYVTFLEKEDVPSKKSYNSLIDIINQLSCDTVQFYEIIFFEKDEYTIDTFVLDSLRKKTNIIDFLPTYGTIGYYFASKKLFVFSVGKNKIRLKKYIHCSLLPDSTRPRMHCEDEKF